MDKREKYKFLLINLSKGLAWLFLIVGIFILLKKYADNRLLSQLDPIMEKPLLVYLLFSFSELFFGLIPPEIFMLWALRPSASLPFFLLVASFSFISYVAGVSGYGIGYYFQTTRFFDRLRRSVLKKHETRLRQFGAALLIVAAFTPVPYSAICMLIGSGKYPFRKFLLFGLSRFFRFGLNAWIVWETSLLV